MRLVIYFTNIFRILLNRNQILKMSLRSNKTVKLLLSLLIANMMLSMVAASVKQSKQEKYDADGHFEQVN